MTKLSMGQYDSRGFSAGDPWNAFESPQLKDVVVFLSVSEENILISK